MTFNVSFIHKNLALRWLFIANDFHDAYIAEYTLKSDIDEVIDELIHNKVDAVGLSVYIFNHEKSKEFIKRLKERAPVIRIIVGGPEPTYQVEDWLSVGVDAVIRGEGEFAFWDAIASKQHLGVATNIQPKAKVLAADLAQLEKVGNPYFLEMDKKDEANRYLYLEASRGCPFSCTYCMAGIEDGVRYFSLEYIKDIINQIEKSDVKTIKFLDRTFNEREVSIQLELEVSIWDNVLHEYFINHGKRDRFRFEIGVQTFSEETLSAVKRKQDNQLVQHVIT
jgi:anaerobic magnesium-protoporphyrin IX monomethyl ester cyclase